MATTVQKQHLDMDGNEIQNVVLQNTSTVPCSKEGAIWYDTVSKKPVFFNGEYTDTIGKDYIAGNGLVKNGLQFSIANNVLTNISADTGSLGIKGSTSGGNAVALGYSANASDTDSIAVGYNSSASGIHSVAIGKDSSTTANSGVAIGYQASSTANNAVQLGKGTNSNSGTLQFMDIQLLDGSGKIPDDRINATIARTSQLPTIPTNVSAFNNDSGYITSYVDTKNTAGATDTSNKIYLIGATSQDANPQTYSNAYCYVGDDNCLYSNGTKVLTSHQSLTNYYTKTEIDGKLSSAMHFKGTIASVSALNQLTGMEVGDMYNVLSTGANYAYDGTGWDKLSENIDLSGYAQISQLPTKTSDLDNDSGYITSFTDTKNTAGSTDTSSKIYLIGATSQAANPQTYSHAEVFVDTSDYLHSTTPASTDNTTKVATTAYVKGQGYITGISGSDVVTALGYTPYNATINPSGFISGISSSDVTTALGYTPCKKITAQNSQLTVSDGSGQVTWNISNTLGTADVFVQVREVSTNKIVGCSITVTESTIKIEMNASTTVPANTYRAVIIG